MTVTADLYTTNGMLIIAVALAVVLVVALVAFWSVRRALRAARREVAQLQWRAVTVATTPESAPDWPSWEWPGPRPGDPARRCGRDTPEASAMTGWYGLTCWNGLSTEQQRKLIERGSLNAFDPEDSTPHGECANPAEVAIETVHDEAPGPRFYCRTCAVAYLTPWAWEFPT